MWGRRARRSDRNLAGAPVARALSGLVSSASPDLILFGQAYDDRDVAGRLGARLGAGVIANAFDVDLAGGTASTTHEIFG